MFDALRHFFFSNLKISLAGYYCLCDLILIWQWWYYRKYYSNGKPIQVDDDEAGGGAPSEETPLVYRRDRRESNSIISALRHVGHAVDNAINIFSPYQLAFIKYTLTTIFVLITAVVAYHTADNASVYVNALKSVDTPNTQTMTLRWDAQLLGWLSALLYLSSRIPQIFKNQQTKCAGLSLALFIFAVGGNVTYVLSILLMDTSSGYLIENASWIVGSVGTIFLDFIVLYQFIKYAPDRRRIEAGYPHHL